MNKYLIVCSGPGSAARQAEALRAEGVFIHTDQLGENYVDFVRYGWFPRHLPSEEAEDDSNNEDED